MDEFAIITIKKTTAMRLALFMEEEGIEDINTAIEELIQIYKEEYKDLE